MKKILHSVMMMVVGAAILVSPGTSSAEDAVTQDTGSEEAYIFPVLKPEVSVTGGYRFVSTRGSSRAEEFEYLHNSAVFGSEVRFFSFPHRFHLDVDVKNQKDYFGDISYSYEDLVQFRGINRTLFHNLDNVNLIDLDPSTVIPNGPMVEVRDAGQQYGVKVGLTNLFLRLKAPDFPLHFYVDAALLNKDGARQEKFMGGAGGFSTVGTAPNNIGLSRVSQKRVMDWTSRDITVGINSHLGPVELDLSHGEKRFTAGGDSVLFENYLDVVSSGKIARAAGEYPHNLISDLKGSTNTLKLHTNYTGGLVASATLAKTERENQISGATSDYFVGSGDLVWTASPRLAVFLKYRHKDVDIDNPGSVTITDRLNPLNTYTFAVAPSISSSTDQLSATVRYRLLQGVTVRGEYGFEDVNRENIGVLDIPDNSQKHTASLSADMRVIKGLMLKAKYTHREINSPAYNTDPNHADEGKISLSWVPTPKISSFLSYSISKEKRNDLIIPENEEAQDRSVRRNMLMGSVTVALMNNLSCTGSYAYFHNKITQDVAIGGIPVDFDDQYKNLAHSYSIDITYAPTSQFTVSGGLSHTLGNAEGHPVNPLLLDPVDISSFSKLKTRETVFSANADYRFKGGFSAGIQYRHTDFKDVLDNPHDDIFSGKAHIALLTISKKW